MKDKALRKRRGAASHYACRVLLFCIYLDALLNTLCSSKTGCFVNTLFTGILASADDIAIMSPTPQAMRRMLSICEQCAAEFAALFNASKSKCIVCTDCWRGGGGEA